jgi:steroid 5-alpha reductase family enzyme
MWHIVVLTLLVSLVINLAMFLVAFKLQSDKLTDISYAVSFIVVAIVGLTNGPRMPRCLYDYLLVAMVCIWAIRIGSFLLYRVIKKGKDGRFDGMREHFLRFGKFWIGQAFTVWLLMLPVSFAAQLPAKLTVVSYAGLVVWCIGLLIEGTADIQKYRFTINPSNKGRWIDEGIWRYSRHPNYFGEIAVWIGVYVFALTVLRGWTAYVSLISPLFIILLLRFVSGVPILEKSADMRWGDDLKYQAYKKRTNLLIPLPKK